MKTKIVRIHVFRMMGNDCLCVQRSRDNGVFKATEGYHPAKHLLGHMTELCQQAVENGTARVVLASDGWQVYAKDFNHYAIPV